jgi:hypothetical protein
MAKDLVKEDLAKMAEIQPRGTNFSKNNINMGTKFNKIIVKGD